VPDVVGGFSSSQVLLSRYTRDNIRHNSDSRFIVGTGGTRVRRTVVIQVSPGHTPFLVVAWSGVDARK